MKRARKIALAALLVLLLPLVLSGCLPGIAVYTPEDPAGFLNGVVHGWFAPISLILELVGMEVTMFAPVNTGFTYELLSLIHISANWKSALTTSSMTMSVAPVLERLAARSRNRSSGSAASGVTATCEASGSVA